MLNSKLRRLRKNNRNLKDSMLLEHEDRYLLQQMFAYLWHKNLNAYDTECLRADLLGMAQEAKQRQQPLRELIGDDRAFCDGLVANCNKNSLSVIVCECLQVIFFIGLASYILFCGGLNPLFGGNHATVVSAHDLFAGGLLWMIYVTLCTKIIPLPYKLFKHSGLLIAFVMLSWFTLRLTALKDSPIFLEHLVFSISGYANLAVLALLALGLLGSYYVADTLSYRQSALGRR